MFQKQNDDISCYGKETKRILFFGTVVTQNVTFRRKKTVLRAKNRLLQTHFCSLEILPPPFFLNLNPEKSRIFLSLSLYRHLSFLALPRWWGSRQWRFCRETVLIGPAERIFVHQWARFYFLFLIFYIFFCAVLIGPGRLRGFSFNTGREKKVKKKKERLARLRGFLFTNNRLVFHFLYSYILCFLYIFVLCW